MNRAVAPLVVSVSRSISSRPTRNQLPLGGPGTAELTLQEFLESRALLPGEATNILIPVLQSLAEVHAAAQVSGRICSADIWLSEAGEARILPPLGHPPGFPGIASAGTRRLSRRSDRGMSRRARAAAIADCQAFVDLCHHVLSFADVEDEGRRELFEKLECSERRLRGTPRREPRRRHSGREIRRSAPPGDTDRRPVWVRHARKFAADCEAALFSVAEPGAIAALQPAPAQTPTHSAPEEPADTVANATGEFDWHAQSASALADIDRAVDRILEADRESHRPRARVTELATRSKEEGARQLTRASSAVRSRWKLVIVGVTVVAVALVGALTAESLPSHPQASGPVLSEAMVSSTPASGAGNNASEPRAASPETPSSQAESSARASRQSTGAATGDDPRAAALALLEERDHCLSGGSAACLAHVDQFQSPLLASDQLQFARGHRVGNQSTPEPVAGAAPLPSVEVVQRTGAAALVSVDPWHGNESQPAGPAPAAHSKPASLLLVKGEAGWRLREVFLADPVDGRRRTGISQ